MPTISIYVRRQRLPSAESARMPLGANISRRDTRNVSVQRRTQCSRVAAAAAAAAAAAGGGGAR